MDIGSSTIQMAPGFAKNPDKLLEVEPSFRRIRAKFNGETIVDSKRVLLMREGGHVPVLYFPMDDIRMDFFTTSHHKTHCGYKGDASYWNLGVGSRSEENVMWSYQRPYAEMQIIKNYVALYWDKMDSWWEEDEEIFGHARDPKKRVDFVKSHRLVEVILEGKVIANSTNCVFAFETNHPVRYYFPKKDVKLGLLSESKTETVCPYKGKATYFSATIDTKVCPDIAWSYEEVLPESTKIKDQICFFNERVDAIVLEEKKLEVPQTKWSL